MKFYLGTHMATFFSQTDVPLFISRRQLFKRKTLPKPLGCWALDSGGFTELNLYGKWLVTPKDYVAEVRRYKDDMGRMDWAAQQDWMCEPFVLKKTGLSVDEHQNRTISNFVELKNLAPDLPFTPVLQGYTVSDYMRCCEKFQKAGIDLSAEPTVGVGSVCRRQHTGEIVRLFRELSSLNLNLHGFGVKKTGIKNLKSFMQSCDSLAWSFNARIAGRSGDVDCPNGKKNCANCLHYALQWRDEILKENQPAPQMFLF